MTVKRLNRCFWYYGRKELNIAATQIMGWLMYS